jgi:hypothetical protein
MFLFHGLLHRVAPRPLPWVAALRPPLRRCLARHSGSDKVIAKKILISGINRCAPLDRARALWCHLSTNEKAKSITITVAITQSSPLSTLLVGHATNYMDICHLACLVSLIFLRIQKSGRR